MNQKTKLQTRRLTAQVAVEAIVEDPTSYDDGAVMAVWAEATYSGVAPLYMSLLAPIVQEVASRG